MGRLSGLLCVFMAMSGWAVHAQAPGGPDSILELTVPAVRPDPLRGAALDGFAAEVSGCLAQGQAEAAQGRTVLAPFGGAKVRPFKELDARGLVIVGWERPGSPEAIARAFAEPDKGLAAALQRGRWSGGMGTTEVMSVPLAAQMLGLLNLELGVEAVELRYLLPPEDAPNPGAGPGVQAWDGGPQGDADRPLLLAFRFTWRGLPRELVHVAYKISSDLQPDRDALPKLDLHRLRAAGFDAGYLSADGLALFSAYPSTFGRKASDQLVASLAGGGVVVLDYPQSESCHRAFFEPRIGFWLMGGRELLTPWGLDLLHRIPVDQPVFGYSGSTLGDCVLVWRKPGERAPERGSAPPFALAGFRLVAPPIQVRLRPAQPAPAQARPTQARSASTGPGSARPPSGSPPSAASRFQQ